MKLSVTYQPMKEYLLVKVSGEYDFSSAIFLFHNILKQAWKQKCKNILCDITRMSGFDFNAQETISRYTIAKYLGTTLPKDIKLAILETPRQLDLFGETIMSNKGANVKITTSMTVALKWIGSMVRKHVYQ
jgi:hypothetical protein